MRIYVEHCFKKIDVYCFSLVDFNNVTSSWDISKCLREIFENVLNEIESA